MTPKKNVKKQTKAPVLEGKALELELRAEIEHLKEAAKFDQETIKNLKASVGSYKAANTKLKETNRELSDKLWETTNVLQTVNAKIEIFNELPWYKKTRYKF